MSSQTNSIKDNWVKWLDPKNADTHFAKLVEDGRAKACLGEFYTAFQIEYNDIYVQRAEVAHVSQDKHPNISKAVEKD